jgi:NADPH2:quinone reductase
VVWDAVGGDAFTAASRAMASEGRILLIGFGSGSWGVPRPEHMAMHNYSVVGVIPSNYGRDYRLATQQRLTDEWLAGRLRTRIHEHFDFEDLPRALETLAGGSVMGKLVVRGRDSARE